METIKQYNSTRAKAEVAQYLGFLQALYNNEDHPFYGKIMRTVNYCTHRMGAEEFADDLYQEILVDFLTEKITFCGNSSFSTFVASIALHKGQRLLTKYRPRHREAQPIVYENDETNTKEDSLERSAAPLFVVERVIDSIFAQEVMAAAIRTDSQLERCIINCLVDYAGGSKIGRRTLTDLASSALERTVTEHQVREAMKRIERRLAVFSAVA